MTIFLYRLTPVVPFPFGKDATSHNGPCIVAANTEEAARRYADLAFMKAVQRVNGRIAVSPWQDERLVRAELMSEAAEGWTLAEVRI